MLGTNDITEKTDTSEIQTTPATSETSETPDTPNMTNLMEKNYTYPEQSDPDIQHKLYKKRELYAYKSSERPNAKDYSDIKEYREKICGNNMSLYEHQAMLSNFINPDTPYKGLLIFHGLGSGKCLSGDAMVSVNGVMHEIKCVWKKHHSDKSVCIDSEGGIWAKPNTSLIVDSYDEYTKTQVRKRVLNLYREKVNTYLKEITTEYNKTIKITDVHKLYTKHNGWTNEFQIGDYINVITQNDCTTYEKITNINAIYYNDHVYDLEIEDTHNFYANNILCHNTCVGVAIAEKFKSMVQKYGQKIYILYPGTLIKENWKYHLIACTGETYLKYQDKSIYVDPAEKAKILKAATSQALQYYRFMSFRSFYKRVLGERIQEKKTTKGTKIKTTYKKNEDGEFERDVSGDRIHSLNNTIILVDEAHNLTDNTYGEALMKVIKNSVNLKVVLLTATPMKNLADDIIPLLNFIRPIDSPIDRDKVFNTYQNYQVDFREGGMEYFKKMARGYISHVRGSDPLLFAKRIDKGEKPKELLFTKVIKCYMKTFQKKVYDTTLAEKEDTLDRSAQAVANFIFPVISQDRKSIAGQYGCNGLDIIKNQIKNTPDILNKKIATELLGIRYENNELVTLTNDGKTITGEIFNKKYLKTFSTKFYRALKKINRLVWGKKGPKLSFVYSYLVKVGIELFEQVLVKNGFLEYKENSAQYRILPDTLCYFCGLTYKDHHTVKFAKQSGGVPGKSTDADADTDVDTDVDTESETGPSIEVSISENIKKEILSEKTRISDSSSDYIGYENHRVRDYDVSKIPEHRFAPATYVSVTGSPNDETGDTIPEEKARILKEVFSKPDNIDGKYIKLVLGSKVMNEGISLKNVAEVHILDVYFNLGHIDQVVGRAIRVCSHYQQMGENNVYPFVNVYKYVISILNGVLTTDEELYRKAELKYLTIKRIERMMKEIAMDCAINMNNNIIREEVEEFRDCSGSTSCPAICDYTKCEYVCDDNKLNAEFYDPTRKIYRNIPKDQLDYTTFTNNPNLSRGEIDYIKQRIKEMFIKKYEYTIQAIIKYVKNSYPPNKQDLFDEFFVFKALDELLPITKNDFIAYKDTIQDKYNRLGYLIYVGNYFVFQPFDENQNIPMYYRTTFDKKINHSLSLMSYLKNTEKFKKIKNEIKDIDFYSDDDEEKYDDNLVYNFDETYEYYNNREEFKYVGIIDKESNRKRTIQHDIMNDIFKIREARPKNYTKGRATGLPSLLGAVCSTSKAKEYLEQIAIELKIKSDTNITRVSLCDQIKDRLLLNEKYGTDGITYIIIPSNHPVYPFPYCLNDRKQYMIESLKETIKFKADISVKTEKKPSGPEKGYPSYHIIIKNDERLGEYNDLLNDFDAKLSADGKSYVIVLD